MFQACENHTGDSRPPGPSHRPAKSSEEPEGRERRKTGDLGASDLSLKPSLFANPY